MNELFEQLQAIASHIDDWDADETVKEDYRHYGLKHAHSGAYVRVTADEKRIRFSGLYGGIGEFRPSWYNNQRNVREYPNDTITVSADRTPEAIARDVQRRLLPVYLNAYEQAHADSLAHQAEKQRQKTVRDLFVKQLGEGARAFSHPGREWEGRFDWPVPGFEGRRRLTRVEGDVSPGGQDVELTLSGMPTHIVKKVLDLVQQEIADYREQRRGEL